MLHVPVQHWREESFVERRVAEPFLKAMLASVGGVEVRLGDLSV